MTPLAHHSKIPPFTNDPVCDTSLPAPCEGCPVRGQAICASLDEHDLGRLARIVQLRYFARGSKFAGEGEPAYNLYNIIDGAVKLYKLLPDGREQVTGFRFPGDFFGLASMVDDSTGADSDGAYNFTAQALGRVRLCRISHRQFKAFLDETPNLESRIFMFMLRKLTEAQEQMLLLGRKSSEEKIASFLLQLADQQKRAGGRDTDGPSVVDLPMTRSDIANFLGLTTETVSRTLTKLKTTGAVRLLENHQILLMDRDRLKETAYGFVDRKSARNATLLP